MNDITALLPHIRLRFNMEHPSFEECYSFGYECAMSEVGEEENLVSGMQEYSTALTTPTPLQNL